MDVMAKHGLGSQRTVAEVVGEPSPRPSRRVRAASFDANARNRLARDLHDGVGESINSLLVQIRLALARGEAGLEDLRSLEQAAQSVMQSVRSLAYGARRDATSNPLEEARLYSEKVLMASGVALTWIDDLIGLRLTHKLLSQLAWSIRESVTNVARHANARAVEVRLSELEGRVRVTVRDDGDGFLPEAVQVRPDGHGLGLLGNAERMAEVGGFVSVRSNPGDGTLVHLEAPVSIRPSLAARSFQETPSTRVMPVVEGTLALTAV